MSKCQAFGKDAPQDAEASLRYFDLIILITPSIHICSILGFSPKVPLVPGSNAAKTIKEIFHIALNELRRQRIKEGKPIGSTSKYTVQRYPLFQIQ